MKLFQVFTGRLWAVLCGILVFFSSFSFGQSGAVQAGTDVSDLVLPGLHGYSSGSARVSDFRGKLLILDFWATWCAPCVSAIPRMDSLQQRYGDRVQFVSVTDQSWKVVEPFLDRFYKVRPQRRIDAQDDGTLASAFGVHALPHMVWIDPLGRFIAHTDGEALKAEEIDRALAGADFLDGHSPERVLDYDPLKPLFSVADPSGDSGVQQYSVLTGFKEGYGSGLFSDVTKADDGTPMRRVTARNLTVAQLYQLAMSDGYAPFSWESTHLRCRDTTALNTRLSGARFGEWLRDGRGFCYELVLPRERAGEAMGIMRLDLERVFSKYRARVLTEKVPVFALVTRPGGLKAGSSGAEPSADVTLNGATLVNCRLDVLTNRLGQYLTKYRRP
ncbi:MAG: TlpA family protein disulfide reductase, partial [Mucilaginibacter polytrichastri]|nr:TlpA family protein disulfide reductase [Mucilaginibacter polytrichastri]